MNQTHPVLDDLVPSVVLTIHRRFRAYTEKADLLQEAWAFTLSRGHQFNELLSDESEVQRKWNEKKIAWQIRRHLERYARKEKAAKSGYQINDEAYYDTVTIAQLLPFVIKAHVTDTALEQSQILVNDGTPRKPAAPAEGGNLLAMLVDIKKGYEKLDKFDQDILRLRYHENQTLQLISEYLECAISTVDRKCSQALRRLQNNIGGESPFN
jgi:DNA-directed RNA polymerase specialized sigma24 family protein